MRHRITAAAALVMLIAWPAPAAAEAPLQIHELYAAPDSAIEGDREFIELYNPGAAVDLTGWSIHDATGNTFTFAEHTIPAGGFLVVWGGGAADGRGPAWSRSTAWNNAGDEATLRDASGAIVDTFAYGNHENATIAAAGTGISLHRAADGWSTAPPTPGYHDEPQGGSIEAVVPNVAPSITGLTAPGDVGRSESVTVTFELSDDNGDPVAWNVTSGGLQLANGTGVGSTQAALVSPSQPGMWAVTVAATDGIESSQQTLHITVRASDLQVSFDGAATLQFDELVPGGTNVTTLGTFRIDNIGSEAITPRIDISDFTGPTTIGVEGNLLLGIDDGSGPIWHVYDGPLTALPEVAAGAGVDVSMRIASVPLPLPAGDYSTSFTVVA